jgi:hypothetical protein
MTKTFVEVGGQSMERAIGRLAKRHRRRYPADKQKK